MKTNCGLTQTKSCTISRERRFRKCDYLSGANRKTCPNLSLIIVDGGGSIFLLQILDCSHKLSENIILLLITDVYCAWFWPTTNKKRNMFWTSFTCLISFYRSSLKMEIFSHFHFWHRKSLFQNSIASREHKNFLVVNGNGWLV